MVNNRKQFYTLGALSAALVGALLIGIPKTTMNTSVVDLLPGEGTEVSILRELAEQEQGRLINVRLFAIDTMVTDAARKAFVESLRVDPHIEKAYLADVSAFLEPGKAILANRFNWLLPFWLDEHFSGWRQNPDIRAEDLAGKVIEQMNQYLDSPEGISLVETIPMDPFLLMKQVLESTSTFTQVHTGSDAIIWVRQKYSPFSSEGQAPVFAALETARRKACEEQAEIKMEYSGVACFAAASKAKIKSEIERLNLLGLILVFVITFLWVSRFRTVLEIFLVVGTALLAAVTAVINFFPSVHVISLVIGSILTGIAVDYAFHLLLEEPGGMPGKSVTKVVITGSLSSALGFIVLVFAPLPFLNQVGVFVGIGLITALLTALLLRTGKQGNASVRHFHLNPFSFPSWTGPLVLLLFLPGLVSVDWKDQISDLEYPLPDLKATDLRLRQQSSPVGSNRIFLVHGSTAVEARNQLLQLQQERDASHFLHLGQWIPDFKTANTAQKFFRAKPGFIPCLIKEMEEWDYLPEQFSPFFSDWQKYIEEDYSDERYQGSLKRFAATLPGPLANMLHLGNGISWFLVLSPKNVEVPQIEGLLELDQSSMLSDAFSSYRRTMIGFSGFCLLLLASAVLIAFGFSAGTRALAIPTMAIIIFAGISSYLGTALGLFHVVGILLAFCIGLDYALFAVMAHRERFHLPGSVAISALTTIGVFGILASSNLPAIRQLALTVLICITASLVLISAGWFSLRRGAVPGRWCFSLLPHGDQAFFIKRVEAISENRIRMECEQELANCMDPAWTIEAMAQSAAVLLADTKGEAKQSRSGMLVVVQNCRIPQRGGDLIAPISCEVESMSNGRDGLLLFKGTCQDGNTTLLAEATFSIFIPPDGIPAERNG